jgi:hypothetical protein
MNSLSLLHYINSTAGSIVTKQLRVLIVKGPIEYSNCPIFLCSVHFMWKAVAGQLTGRAEQVCGLLICRSVWLRRGVQMLVSPQSVYKIQ